jgi:hypothetical protein
MEDKSGYKIISEVLFISKILNYNIIPELKVKIKWM